MRILGSSIDRQMGSSIDRQLGSSIDRQLGSSMKWGCRWVVDDDDFFLDSLYSKALRGRGTFWKPERVSSD